MGTLNLFQWLTLAAVALLALGTMLALVRRLISWPAAAFWLVVSVAAWLAILDPDATSRVSKWLGIERGADLISYLTTVAVLFGFWLLYIRLRRLRREITVLTRELALLRAEREPPSSNPPADPPLHD